MRRLPPSLAPAGYSPARYAPLSPAMVSDQGMRLTDMAAIQRLFANGENGGYWPADPAYLYEDSEGTIPASVNGVVGLRLGVGTVYQPVTVVNGGFDTDSGWIKGAGWTITDGVASFNNATGNNLYQSASLVAGAAYIVTWTMTKSAGIIRPVFFGGTTVYGAYGTVGNNKQILIAATGNNQLLFEASAGTVCTIDNVTLTRVTPSPAIQATTANKPYLRRTPVSNKTWLDSNTSTGALTATFASALGSACTIATVGAEGVTIADNQTITTTYNLTPPYGYNGDVLIINRALTAAEKALVTRILKRNAPYYPSIVDARLQMRGYAPNNENTVDTSIITNFAYAWFGCSGLTSFPLINTAAGTDFSTAWAHCSSLTSFPLINTAAGTTFACAWFGCSGLTSFPLINTAAGTIFAYAWYGCSGLTSFPLINTAAGTTFAYAWYGCSGLTSFPANFFDSWMGVPIANCFSSTWDSCIKLTLASVQNIVVSLVVSGKSAPATGTDISLDGAPTLVAIQADTTVMTAVATLKSRNWTPKYKGTAL